MSRVFCKKFKKWNQLNQMKIMELRQIAAELCLSEDADSHHDFPNPSFLTSIQTLLKTKQPYTKDGMVHWKSKAMKKKIDVHTN